MKIHQVIATQEPRHDVDPVRGVILRMETVLKAGTALTIAGGDHGSFDIGEDGAFDVPDELGEFLLSTPGWFEGTNPFYDGSVVVPEPEPEPVEPTTAKKTPATAKKS